MLKCAAADPEHRPDPTRSKYRIVRINDLRKQTFGPHGTIRLSYDFAFCNTSRCPGTRRAFNVSLIVLFVLVITWITGTSQAANPKAPKALLREMKGHSSRVLSVSFSPDGRYLLSASQDRSIRLWNTGSGEELLRLQ